MKNKHKNKLFLLKENVAILRHPNSIIGGNSETCGGETTDPPKSGDDKRIKVYKCIVEASDVMSWSYAEPIVE